MSIRKKIIKDFFNSSEMNRDKWLRKGSTFHAEDLKFLKEIIPEKSNILELENLGVIEAFNADAT